MKIIVVLLAVGLAGCSTQLQMMSRDGGKVYPGTISSNGMGGGSLTVTLDGKSCSGRFVQSSSGDSYGFAQTYGRRGVSTTFVQTMSGHGTYKALLSCTDGSGVRCDAEGSTTGSGICVDSRSKVYDMIYM